MGIEGIIDLLPIDKPVSNRDINKPYIKKIGELNVDPLDEVYLSIASYVTKVVDKINKDNEKKYVIKLIEVDTYYMKVKVEKKKILEEKWNFDDPKVDEILKVVLSCKKMILNQICHDHDSIQGKLATIHSRLIIIEEEFKNKK